MICEIWNASSWRSIRSEESLSGMSGISEEISASFAVLGIVACNGLH